jgi:hypothetical protein
MKMAHKFRNKNNKNNVPKTINETNNNSILEINNSKSYLTNSTNLPTLSKLIRTEEDFLFKSDRKIQNDNEVYKIENKMEQNQRNENLKDIKIYERENYISNRDTKLPLKIINKEYEKLSIEQKNEDLNHNNSLEKNKKILKNNLEKKKKKCFLKFSLYIFLIIVILIIICLLVYYFYYVFFKNKK